MNNSDTGAILKRLTAFSVPLILSGLLQQLFNWVDALIVGNVVGEAALAAIGATSSMYNLFVGVLIGFTSGLSVLFAQQYGGGNQEKNGRLLAVYSVLMTAVFAAISALGVAFISPILGLLDTPASLVTQAGNYLRVIFFGVPFLALYNVYSAALRGMGNSKAPFAAVVISSLTNALLDWLFVARFGMGVSGAALATVISQGAMTLYTVIYTAAKHPDLRFSPFKLESYAITVKSGVRYGAPPAIQSSVGSVGTLFLQRLMNSFGEQTVAAITTAYRVDSVLLLPIFNFGTAISTLVAQETGAGNREAAKKILKTGSVMMTFIALSLTAVILAVGGRVLSLFGLTEASVEIGKSFFLYIAPFYVVCGLVSALNGYLKGVSDLMFAGMADICSLGVRIVCSYIFAPYWGNAVIAYAEAISWVFLLAVCFIRYKKKTSQ